MSSNRELNKMADNLKELIISTIRKHDRDGCLESRIDDLADVCLRDMILTLPKVYKDLMSGEMTVSDYQIKEYEMAHPKEFRDQLEHSLSGLAEGLIQKAMGKSN